MITSKKLLFVIVLLWCQLAVGQITLHDSTSAYIKNFGTILGGLTKISQAEGFINHVTFKIAPNHQVMVAGSKNDMAFYCEATAIENQNAMDNTYSFQESYLMEQGWSPPLSEEARFYLIFSVSNPSDLKVLAYQITSYFRVFFEDKALSPENVELVLEED